MIDHITLQVSDFKRALDLYKAALAPLGYEVVMHITRKDYPQMETEEAAGLGANGKPDFWLVPTDKPVVPTHVAITAPDRKTVDAFHAAALKAGAKDNGAPGLRPYHEHYYGAFALDPDGNNFEAVCHTPE